MAEKIKEAAIIILKEPVKEMPKKWTADPSK